MFFTISIDAALGILNNLIQFFPLADSTIVASIDDQLTIFRNFISSMNWLFPVSDFFTAVTAIFLIESVLLSYKIIRYILSVLTLNVVK